MIPRMIEKELLKVAKEFPVVTIIGPRQSGKTTLAKMTFPEYTYANLEDPEIRQLAETDPRAFLILYKTPLIIDEVQRVPSLLSYIQIDADSRRRMGDYILTGSFQLGLKAAITQSLAGRTALLTLLPLSLEELSNAEIQKDRDDYLYTGFMPALYESPRTPELLYRNYFQTYVERDVQQLMQVRNLAHFEKFIKLLAGRIGKELNLSSLANDVGISATTLHEWMSILEASFVIFRLQPYFNNFGKRLIKSPKIYFTEVGLVSYLLGIRNPEQAARDPLLGALFENMVVMEALKAQYNRGIESSLYYFKDNNGLEVDLLIDSGRRIYPIEIKASRTFNSELSASLNRFKRISGENPSTLIYAGELEVEANGVMFRKFSRTAQVVENCMK